MSYRFKKFFILFTLWASLSATPQQVGKADVYPPPADHPIFCACPAIADQATADCQGLAVDDYSFALGRLEAGAPSTFAQLG